MPQLDPTLRGESDHRLERNYLHETNGDRINAMLAAAAFNLRKMTRAFLCVLLSGIRNVLEHARFNRWPGSIGLRGLHPLPRGHVPIAA